MFCNRSFRFFLQQALSQQKSSFCPFFFQSPLVVHYLSKKKACKLVSIVHEVPQGLESNKGNIYMASSSPPSVLKAYYEQFQSHFSMFLRCRSEELLGGSMVLTFLGRSDDPSSKECCYIWELLAVAINDMVAEVHIQFLHALMLPICID